MHPLIFGFSQGAKVVGLTNTEEVRKQIAITIDKQMSWGQDEAQKMLMIHPLYVSLQQNSPIGMLRTYSVAEIDQLNNPIDIKEFYK